MVIELTPAADELLAAEARAREVWLTGQLDELSTEEQTMLRAAVAIIDKLAVGDPDER